MFTPCTTPSRVDPASIGVAVGRARAGSRRPRPRLCVNGPSRCRLRQNIHYLAPMSATKSKTTERSVTWYRWEELPREKVSAMLDRRLITGDRMMLAHVYLKQGCIVPKHTHENEQFTYILEGALRFWIGDDEREELVVRAGEVLHIPSNVPH